SISYTGFGILLSLCINALVAVFPGTQTPSLRQIQRWSRGLVCGHRHLMKRWRTDEGWALEPIPKSNAKVESPMKSLVGPRERYGVLVCSTGAGRRHILGLGSL